MSTKLEISADAKKILESIKKAHSKSVKVGWFEGLTYDDKDKTPVAAVAAQNEFGNPSKNIPARPFLRPTIIREENNWIKIAEKGAGEFLKGKQTIDGVLELLGRRAVGDVQRSIRQVYSPALKEQTILARIQKSKRLSKITGQIGYKALGNITKPLVDTGHMISTVSYELSDE